MTQAEEWSLRGIDFETTDPIPTDELTSQQLKDLGIVAVVLIVPRIEANSSDI